MWVGGGNWTRERARICAVQLKESTEDSGASTSGPGAAPPTPAFCHHCCPKADSRPYPQRSKADSSDACLRRSPRHRRPLLRPASRCRSCVTGPVTRHARPRSFRITHRLPDVTSSSAPMSDSFM